VHWDAGVQLGLLHDRLRRLYHHATQRNSLHLPRLSTSASSGAGGMQLSIVSTARTLAAANQLHVAAAVDQRDRQTDGRMSLSHC